MGLVQACSGGCLVVTWVDGEWGQGPECGMRLDQAEEDESRCLVGRRGRECVAGWVGGWMVGEGKLWMSMEGISKQINSRRRVDATYYTSDKR